MSSTESKVQQNDVELKGIQRSSSTVRNKCDNFVGQIKDILKRLAKVEKKNEIESQV